MTQAAVDAAQLRRRGAALALFARVLGPGPWDRARAGELRVLRRVLAELGEWEAAAQLVGVRGGRTASRTWGWLFEQGRVSPYEMSYFRPGLGGHLGRIADVAGFARAFGLAVPKERPDHFCAEVELAAFLTLGEAEALERGDRAGAEVYGSAAAAFLRDHLGCWLDLLAARARAAAPAGPWGPVLGALDRFVAAEAARRGVAPRRHGRIDGGIDEAGEEGPPTCGACPAAGTGWQQGPLAAEGGTT